MENKLFVGNLAWASQEEDLKDLFGQFGSVERVDVMRDKFTGKARGFAFVTMSTADEANKCVKGLDGSNFMERALNVNIAKPREEGARPARRN